MHWKSNPRSCSHCEKPRTFWLMSNIHPMEFRFTQRNMKFPSRTFQNVRILGAQKPQWVSHLLVTCNVALMYFPKETHAGKCEVSKNRKNVHTVKTLKMSGWDCYPKKITQWDGKLTKTPYFNAFILVLKNVNNVPVRSNFSSGVFEGLSWRQELLLLGRWSLLFCAKWWLRKKCFMISNRVSRCGSERKSEPMCSWCSHYHKKMRGKCEILFVAEIAVQKKLPNEMAIWHHFRHGSDH